MINYLDRIRVFFINLKSWRIKRAIFDLKKAMHNDSYFAHTWQCNIAITILDNTEGKLTHKESNDVADLLMNHLFDYRKTID